MKTAQLRGKIESAFAASMGEPEVARDIAFHMTDWDHDLEDLLRLYDQAETVDEEEVLEVLLRFLAHVPNHIAAAKKLSGMGPIEDIFQVGVLEEDKE